MPTEKFNKNFKRFKEDSTHGAVYLTMESLRILRAEVEESTTISEEIAEIIKQIMECHVEIASIANAMRELQEKILKKRWSRKDIIKTIDKEIQQVKDRELQTARNTAKEITKFNVFMTLSSSMSILNAFREIPKEDRQQEIYILESRPHFEGRLQAERLAREGYQVNLIVDSAAGYFAKEVDAIIVGADTVFTDGSIINKIGSFPLASLANYLKKPFIVSASSNKLSNVMIPEKHSALIQERPKEEVMIATIENITPKNVYFDFVPAELITKIISEEQ